MKLKLTLFDYLGVPFVILFYIIYHRYQFYVKIQGYILFKILWWLGGRGVDDR